MFYKLNKNQYVMNKKSGKCFKVTTGEVQSRGRYQVEDMQGKTSVDYRFVYNHLAPITEFEAAICTMGEKILRGKHKMSEAESTIVALHRALKKTVVA